MDGTKIASRMLAGISVPDTPLIDRTIEYARQKCEPYLFNHVVRSWLFAARIGQLQSIEHDAEVVAVGTLLHDITLNKRFPGPRRFEVEGADIARSFRRKAGFDKRRAQLIWDSVALNSTPSIGLYKESRGGTMHRRHLPRRSGPGVSVIPSNEMIEIVARISTASNESRMTRCFCSIAEVTPRNDLRQLHPGFRRALCAWLQSFLRAWIL